MQASIVATLMIIGAAFMFVAAIGIIRMPDLFLRMSAVSKAATLGAMSSFLAAACYFARFGITSRSLAAIFFLLLTAHVIGRAAYLIGVPLWKGTVCDELRASYESGTHAPARPKPPEAPPT